MSKPSHQSNQIVRVKSTPTAIREWEHELIERAIARTGNATPIYREYVTRYVTTQMGRWAWSAAILHGTRLLTMPGAELVIETGLNREWSEARQGYVWLLALGMPALEPGPAPVDMTGWMQIKYDLAQILSGLLVIAITPAILPAPLRSLLLSDDGGWRCFSIRSGPIVRYPALVTEDAEAMSKLSAAAAGLLNQIQPAFIGRPFRHVDAVDAICAAGITGLDWADEMCIKVRPRAIGWFVRMCQKRAGGLLGRDVAPRMESDKCDRSAGIARLALIRQAFAGGGPAAPAVPMSAAQTNSPEPAVTPPATITESPPRPDGPEEPHTLWMGGKSYQLQPRSWRLLAYMWSKQTAQLWAVKREVFENENVTDQTVMSAVSRLANSLLEKEIKLGWELTKRGDFLAKTE